MSGIELEIQNLIGKLHNIKTNLKKSPFRRYLKSTLKDKILLTKTIYNKVVQTLLKYEDVLDNRHVDFFIKAARLDYDEIIYILETKLKKYSKPISLKSLSYAIIFNIRLIKISKKVKMALNIKTASELASLIPSYDGNPGGVKSFIDAIRLVQTIVPADQQAPAIQLILTRLTGKARDLFTGVPANYQEIVDKISADCTDKSSSELALANLKNIKPKKGQETSGFTKEVDILADKLKQAYIREEVPNEVAKKLANKAAIQSLIIASQKQETKMLLKVGKFDSLSEALNIVVENENFNNEPSVSMLQMRKKFPQNKPSYQSNYQNRNNGNNSRGNFRGFTRNNTRQTTPNFPQQSSNRFLRYNYQNTNHQHPRQQNWNHSGNRRLYHMNEVDGSMLSSQFAPNGALPQPVSMVPSNMMPPQRQHQQPQQVPNHFLGTTGLFPYSR